MESRMVDSSKLPHLLKLISDDSSIVREAVSQELLDFGPSLHEELKLLSPPPSEEEQEQIADLIQECHLKRLKEKWGEWKKLPSNDEKLENGLELLSNFQNGPHYPATLGFLLDKLAKEYGEFHSDQDVFKLAQFLFQTKRLQGAQEDYYNPANSNLVYVIENRKGIPISLACIYILTAHRLGLAVEGCNFPNHFLARVYDGGKMLLVDCFNGGKCYSETEVLEMLTDSKEALQDILHIKADAESILRRVLSNLIWAYQKIGRLDESQWLSELARDLNG